MATESVLAVEELKKKVALYEEILDMVSQGVFVTDMEGRIVWMNEFSACLENLDREKLIGEKEQDIWPNPEVDFFDGKKHKATDVLARHGRPHILSPYREGKTSLLSTSYQFNYNNKPEYNYSVGFYLDYTRFQFLKIMEYQQLLRDNTDSFKNKTRFSFADFIGESMEIKALLELAHKVAVKNSPVLIYGETGTGKEILAHSIHNASAFQEGNFMPVNCAAIPDTLLETVLFGSIKGSFTGAMDKKGFIEEAEGGTLFLDEINSMPLNIQGKLLRMLQEKKFTRVGSSKEIKVNCRIISATNQDPWLLMENQTLREDLFFRLSTVTLTIPPLVKRKDDIPLLVKHFIEKFNKEFDLSVTGLDRQCMEFFTSYNWPGNVRELEHVIEYMMNIGSDSGVLKYHLLPFYLISAINKQKAANPAVSPGSSTLPEMLDKYEKMIISEALKNNQGNISRTAKELGILRETLYYRLKKLNIPVKAD